MNELTLNKTHSMMKMQFQTRYEDEYVNKKNETKVKVFKRKFGCDFDPYDHTKLVIEAEEHLPFTNVKQDEYHEHHYNIKNLEWSLYKEAENTHDAHFAYLDHLAHEHDVNLRLHKDEDEKQKQKDKKNKKPKKDKKSQKSQKEKREKRDERFDEL